MTASGTGYMTLAGDTDGMDRGDLTDRLPNLSLDRVPGIGGESEPEPPDSFDEPTERSDAAPPTADTRDEGGPADEAVNDSVGETGGDEDEPEEERTPSRREQARKALLGVSVGGAALAVLAAVVRRLLGEDESEGDDVIVDAEPEAERPEPAPDAEAVAAVVGLAFQVLVRRLAGEDELEA
ncbi:hypothetical protein HSBGL_0203 [Halapricum desulfuricans]|uniref:Uncharacterized protein n=2 Tax=Halapricum desulfuricans TaxID=2841257 RepID=A0A897NE02_9EURY|nr:hypothetical protein HSBGL_0203 [Halapricum desulfuricans]